MLTPQVKKPPALTAPSSSRTMNGALVASDEQAGTIRTDVNASGRPPPEHEAAG